MSPDLDRFDRLYAADDDPWGFRDRWYEQRKYALTVAALTRPRYGRGLELGCSIGVLTRLLAARCDALLAVDGAGRAVALARAATADLAQVTVERAVLPGGFPAGRFDLVVCSELAYYLAAPERAELIARTVAALPAGGELVAVHWRGRAADLTTTGAEVHAELRGHTRRSRPRPATPTTTSSSTS